MVDAIVLGGLALVDLGFLVFLRLRRRQRKRRERMSDILTGYVRRENKHQIPKRRRLFLLKAQ